MARFAGLNKDVKPAAPAPRLFGPSFLKVVPHADGFEHTACLWIGGRGLAVDGRFGAVLNLIFTDKQANPAFVGTEVVANMMAGLVEQMGAEDAEAVGTAWLSTLAGNPLAKSMTAAEIKELIA